MLHVVILVHEQDRFESSGYFLHAFVELWREQGIRVSVSNAANPPDADLAMLHVDLTVVPTEYVAAARRFPKVINAGVIDISKRRISANLVNRGDGYDGPVIVKTDLNCGGQKEARLAAGRRSPAGLAHALRRLVPWSRRSRLTSADYRIYSSPRAVPRAAWQNPAFVVERFLPERSNGYYCLRTWIFFGDRETNGICYSHHPIVKANNIVRRDPFPEVPADLRRMRREFGFDFGKFDYAVVDGRTVLYDANRTPTLPGFPREQLMSRVRLLAEGLRPFCQAASSERVLGLQAASA